MEIDVLSSAAGRSSGYVVRHGGASVLVDCGPGTAVALARAGALETLDAVVITHQHADHAADVIGLAYARRFPDPMASIPLLAPAATLAALRRLDNLFAVPTLPQMGHTISNAFELDALPMDGTPMAVAGGLELTSYAVAHAVPSAALRFSGDGVTATFSSDTGVCDAVVEAAAGVEVFLCEATYLQASPAQLQGHGHLTPELAAGIALKAAARRLVLAHFSRPGDAGPAVAAAGRILGPAAVSAAESGRTIVV